MIINNMRFCIARIIGKLCVSLVVMLGCIVANAQETAEFTADRPGASTGPAVVGHKVVQLEQGVQYDGDGGAGAFTFSNTLLRYGLFPNMELRLGGDGFIYKEDSVSPGFKPAFSGLSVGTKIKCFDGRGAIPAVSVLADFSIPCTASQGFNVDHLAPSLYLLFDNPVCDSRRMLIAKTFADILNRSVQPKTITLEDTELKVKGIGYNDYLN